MKNRPADDQDSGDQDFEDTLSRMMRSCGWLLPKSPDDLRRAEAELAADPVELPASLRDPFRVLYGAEMKAIDETSRTSPLGSAMGAEVRIPSGLQRLASELGLSFNHVTSLIGMQAQIIANRSTSRNEDPSYEDWKRFYEAVKEFL
jgi:hypothetical protein